MEVGHLARTNGRQDFASLDYFVRILLRVWLIGNSEALFFVNGPLGAHGFWLGC